MSSGLLGLLPAVCTAATQLANHSVGNDLHTGINSDTFNPLTAIDADLHQIVHLFAIGCGERVT